MPANCYVLIAPAWRRLRFSRQSPPHAESHVGDFFVLESHAQACYTDRMKTIYIDPTPTDLWRELAHWATLGYIVKISPVPNSLGTYVELTIIEQPTGRVVYSHQFQTTNESAPTAKQLLWARVIVKANSSES